MTFRNGRPKASFNILVIRYNSNLAVTFINRTKPEKNSNFPQYFCHRKGSATTIYEISLWLPGIRRTRYRVSCRLLFWVLVPTHVSPFWRFVWQGFSFASAAAYYGIIDQKCWLLFVCHYREAHGCEQKEYSWQNSTKC